VGALLRTAGVHRQVTGLDVFERIANGVSMPYEAWVLMGLVPASAAARRAFAGRRRDRPDIGTSG
jgi:hypothetical protein